MESRFCKMEPISFSLATSKFFSLCCNQEEFLTSFNLNYIVTTVRLQVILIMPRLNLKKPKNAPQLRELKIKSGCCRRLAADVREYLKEKKTQETKLNQMNLEGADEGDIRRQDEFLSETEATLRDTGVQLRGAFNELHDIIMKYYEDSACNTSEEFNKAFEQLQLTGALIGVPVEIVHPSEQKALQEAAPEAAPPPEAEPRLQVRGAAATEKVGADAGDAEVQLESKGALQLDIVKNIEHVTDCEDSHPELMRSMYVSVSLYLC